ncbi:hypothetical protein DFH11DRAFT_1747923 [Phellopilus nigrolimitatus]|nr:hypothetical protein DFH11DRAFT_1747923 [Phellopilus nigrolimitatus]
MAQRTTIQHILSGNMRKAYLCFDFLLDLRKLDKQRCITRGLSSRKFPLSCYLTGRFKLLEPENRRLPACDFDARRHRRDRDSSLFELSYKALAMRKVSSIEHTAYDTYRNGNQLDELVQKVSNYLPTSILSLVYRLLIPKLILCSVIVLDGEMAGDGKMARTLQMLRLVPLLRQSEHQETMLEVHSAALLLTELDNDGEREEIQDIPSTGYTTKQASSQFQDIVLEENLQLIALRPAHHLCHVRVS